MTLIEVLALFLVISLFYAGVFVAVGVFTFKMMERQALRDASTRDLLLKQANKPFEAFNFGPPDEAEGGATMVESAPAPLDPDLAILAQLDLER